MTVLGRLLHANEAREAYTPPQNETPEHRRGQINQVTAGLSLAGVALLAAGAVLGSIDVDRGLTTATTFGVIGGIATVLEAHRIKAENRGEV